jgi:hypothetical protein
MKATLPILFLDDIIFNNELLFIFCSIITFTQRRHNLLGLSVSENPVTVHAMVIRYLVKLCSLYSL